MNTHNLIAPNLIKFSKGNFLARQTFPASDLNLKLLHHFKINKMILHVRDPRQAVISWMYYLQNRGKRFKNNIHPDQELTLLYWRYPKNLIDLNIDEQIEWHINNYYVENVKWIKSWIAFKKKNKLELGGQVINIKLDIFFSTFENFVNDQKKFIVDILDFYNFKDYIIDDNEIFRDHSKIPNYRKGFTNEWRDVMSKNQIDKVNSYLDKEICNFFNWNY